MDFNLTVEEVNLVLSGLLELPAKNSMNLILKLQREAKQQLDKLAEAGKKE